MFADLELSVTPRFSEVIKSAGKSHEPFQRLFYQTAETRCGQIDQNLAARLHCLDIIEQYALVALEPPLNGRIEGNLNRVIFMARQQLTFELLPFHSGLADRLRGGAGVGVGEGVGAGGGAGMSACLNLGSNSSRIAS